MVLYPLTPLTSETTSPNVDFFNVSLLWRLSWVFISVTLDWLVVESWVHTLFQRGMFIWCNLTFFVYKMINISMVIFLPSLYFYVLLYCEVFLLIFRGHKKILSSNFRKSHGVDEPLSSYDAFLVKTFEIKFFLSLLGDRIVSCGV